MEFPRLGDDNNRVELGSGTVAAIFDTEHFPGEWAGATVSDVPDGAGGEKIVSEKLGCSPTCLKEIDKAGDATNRDATRGDCKGDG